MRHEVARKLALRFSVQEICLKSLISKTLYSYLEPHTSNLEPRT
jgi:hypothetical protein